MTSLTWDRHQGHASGYDVVELGYNYRLDELRAALGIVQLERLDELNEVRAALVARYRERLKGSSMAIPCFGDRGRSANHLCVVVAPSNADRERARVLLGAEGIQSSIHYPAIHRFSHYRRRGDRLPVAEEIADRALTVPLHPKLTGAAVDEVCDILLGV
jgi:dTDP-4-amino-4,6-dideoxygalactose transaminase